MGRFRDPVKKGSNGPKFPGIYLTWNAGSGTFRGSVPTPDGEYQSVDMRNMDMVILEPSLYRVTGQSKDRRIKIWSNLAKTFTHDELKVMATTKGQGQSNHEVLAEGLWSDIKKTPLPQHMPRMRYTKCVAVAILKSEVSEYDREKGKPGEFKEVSYEDDYQIAILQLRGHSIIMRDGKSIMEGVSWAGSLSAADFREDDCDGCYMGCFDVFETKSQDGKDTWKQPMFKFTESEKLPEDVLDKAAEKYEVVKAYLEAHWGHEDYFADDEPDTPEDNDESMSDGIEADNLGAKGKKAMF